MYGELITQSSGATRSSVGEKKPLVEELRSRYPENDPDVEAVINCLAYIKINTQPMKIKGQDIPADNVRIVFHDLTTDIAAYGVDEYKKKRFKGEKVTYPNLWITAVLYRRITAPEQQAKEQKDKAKQYGNTWQKSSVTPEENAARLKKDLEWLEQFSKNNPPATQEI